MFQPTSRAQKRELEIFHEDNQGLLPHTPRHTMKFKAVNHKNRNFKAPRETNKNKQAQIKQVI